MQPSLSGWIAEARRLADYHDLTELRTQIDDLATLLNRPVFQVALAGESSAAKAALVDLLVGQRLGTAAAPELATVTIAAGDRERVELRCDDGAVECPSLPLDAEAIADAAQGQTVHDVRVTLTGSSLSGTPLELVETPTLNRSRPADRIAGQAAAASDVVVMVTPAMAALSQTEFAFLSDVGAAGNVLDVFVVVARLDQVDEADRAAVVAAVRHRALALLDSVEIFTAPHADDQADLDLLERRLIEAATAADRVGQRHQQLAWRLLAQVGQVVEVGRRALAVAELSGQQRAEEAAKERERSKVDEQRWEELRAGLEKRHKAAVTELRRQLEPSRAAIAEDLREASRAATDPVTWFNSALAGQLRRSLEQTAKTHNEWLAHRMELDLSWLDLRVNELRLDADPLALEAGRPPEIVERGEPPLRPVDMQRARLLYRYLPPGAVFAGSMLIPGVGPGLAVVAAGAAFVIGDRVYRGQVRDLERAVQQATDRVVQEAVDDLIDGAERQLRAVYTQISDAVSGLHLAWRRDVATAVAVAAEPMGQPDRWRDLVRDADALRLTIAQTLSTTTDPEDRVA